MADTLDPLEHAKSTLLDLAIRFGPKLAVAILIVVAGAVVAGWVGRGVDRGLHRFDLEPPVRQLLNRLARLLIIAVFLMMALQNMGVELLPLIAGLGVAGAGIALATQGVLSNVVAGFTIIFTKPYRVGQYIGVAGVEGQVEQITLFSTVLLHADRSMVVVPNRKAVGEILHNYGKIRQVEVLVGVAYESDLVTALGAIRELVGANPRVLADPAPLIQITALGDSAVQIAVRPWVAVSDFGAVSGELNLSLLQQLKERGIGIPYPQREVRLIGGTA
ncbi:MAG TPA: mechanosensitive ion channel family protein [Steroidobacteraceae bacterium]|jgi:small conductance mechanosensitive channel|nr:mechanosensitive ion channel family protein [Steroidobacteraceae bacterium]